MAVKEKRKNDGALAEELRRVQEDMDETAELLDRCADPRLLEAAVWRLKYCQAKYDWLLEQARISGCTGADYFR